ncbi:MAG TPA: periplasmic heavy metal sensor [Blastocatellia bacterium]|nr:periplasmic heavy metal sensor [Blastocatellia bacterium]
MKRAFSLMTLIVILAAGVSLARAQGLGRSLPVLKNRLGLTDQQVAEIQDLLRKHRDAIFPLQQELRAKQHELAKALEAPQPDATAVGRLVIEQRSLRQQIQKLNQQLHADVRAVLTPEQQQKFDEWQRSRPQRPGQQLRRPVGLGLRALGRGPFRRQGL